MCKNWEISQRIKEIVIDNQCDEGNQRVELSANTQLVTGYIQVPYLVDIAKLVFFQGLELFANQTEHNYIILC